MDRVEIKKEAKEFAFKNKWNIWKPILIICLIEVLVGLVLSLCGLGVQETTVKVFEFDVVSYQLTPVAAVVELVLNILLMPLMIGLNYYHLNLVRGKTVDTKDLFSKYKYLLPIFVITLLVGIFTALWTLLLIIPGIIYAFSVAMVPYLLADELDESTGYMDLINRSREMMKGHKLDYFIFELSFIGWYLLVGITFGIASIWVVPYNLVANIKFYERLK